VLDVQRLEMSGIETVFVDGYSCPGEIVFVDDGRI
jgi:hypothetical protein